MDFEQKYWSKNFSEPETMDGVYNAHAHARYLKSLWQLEELPPIKNMVDLGMGLGLLTLEMMRALTPTKTVGVELSQYAFGQAKKNLVSVTGPGLILKNMSLEEWCEGQKKSKTVFELGICASVWQYLTDESLKKILPILSKKIRYLYLTVPTDQEQKFMKKDLGFVDDWALSRTQAQYLKFLGPYFAVVSSRLLESKSFYTPATSPFTNLLYRF